MARKFIKSLQNCSHPVSVQKTLYHEKASLIKYKNLHEYHENSFSHELVFGLNSLRIAHLNVMFIVIDSGVCLFRNNSFKKVKLYQFKIYYNAD